MCLIHRQLDAKSRRIYRAGVLCLVASLLLSLFDVHGFIHGHEDLFLVLRFVLIISAIGLLSWAGRRSGCCAAPPERNS